jgi:hypothetical protein
MKRKGGNALSAAKHSVSTSRNVYIASIREAKMLKEIAVGA